jgi:hypothetical protein
LRKPNSAVWPLRYVGVVHSTTKENVMLGSTVLEVAVGLTFCYATVALIVSTVQEALASALSLRAHTLLDGIKSMLNDPKFTGLARSLYSHALVNPHDSGNAANQHALKAKPSYIEPVHFAIALVDAIQTMPGNYAQLGRDIDQIGDQSQARAARRSPARRRQPAGVPEWRGGLVQQRDGARLKVPKRRSLLVSLLLSLLLAILFNIDSIHLFRSLAASGGGRPAGGGAVHDHDRTPSTLFSLPIGWVTFPPVFSQAFALQVVGWMITASTALFGAPFWIRPAAAHGAAARHRQQAGRKAGAGQARTHCPAGRWASISRFDTDSWATRSGHWSPGPNQRASAISAASTLMSPPR